MNKDFLELTQQLFKQKLNNPRAETRVPQTKNPVHVVYGGADRFSAEAARETSGPRAAVG